MRFCRQAEARRQSQLVRTLGERLACVNVAKVAVFPAVAPVLPPSHDAVVTGRGKPRWKNLVRNREFSPSSAWVHREGAE